MEWGLVTHPTEIQNSDSNSELMCNGGVHNKARQVLAGLVLLG